MVSGERTRLAELEARYDRMRALIEEAQRWHARPIAGAFAHHTRGLARADRAAALVVALEFLIAGATMPGEKFDAPVSLAEFSQLPPLDRAIDWAGYAIVCVVANTIAEVPQTITTPRDPQAA